MGQGTLQPSFWQPLLVRRFRSRQAPYDPSSLLSVHTPPPPPPPPQQQRQPLCLLLRQPLP